MRTKFAAITAIVFLLMAAVSAGAECPTVATIGSISGSGGQFHPLRIAVDLKGNFYVTDGEEGLVNAYDSSGSLIKTKRVGYPLGVAVDSSGRVYVGTAEPLGGGIYRGAVTVYDAGLNPLYTLGSGTGEFKYPVGIATDAERVYVADSRANIVKVYKIADGSFLFSFGGYGLNPGNLVRPDNVAVHPSTGNLFVADRALVYDSQSGGYGLGAAVHEFTRDGVFIRKFGSYGFDETPGVISLIGGMAIDASGRVIVSDYNKGYLHVFEAGAPVCIARYEGSYGSLPQGLAGVADGRLLVGASGRVIELGLGSYAKMSVSPAELEFSAQGCGGQPAAKSITVSNSGPGVLSFTVASDSSWLVPAPSGEVSGTGSAEVSVSVNKEGLSEGSYAGALTVSYAGGERSVGVTMEVLPPGVLSVSPSSIAFSSEGDPTPPSQALSIGLSGGGSWSAASDSSWLAVSPSEGSSDTATVAQVRVDGTALGSGQFTGNITVTSGCASNSPVVVPVAFDLVMGGTVEVASNIAEASYTVSGPRVFTGSGVSSTFEGAPAGTYTVTFNDVAGFKTPASYSLELAVGGTASFRGDYVDLRRSLGILAATGAKPSKVKNELKVFEGGGALLDAMVLREEVSQAYNWDNSVPASGDVDGDGAEELIISHDMGIVTGLKADGTLIAGLNFRPYAYSANVDVTVADLDGDGAAEIITGPMGLSDNGSAVRVFSFKGGVLSDTGINFLAYTAADYLQSLKSKNGLDRRGVRVAAGDTDGDGVAEIITVQGGEASKHNIRVRVFKVDASQGAGKWRAVSAGNLSVTDMVSYYSDVAAGDLDGDGTDEIVVSDTPLYTSLPQAIAVLAFDADGTRLLDVDVVSIRGVEVAAGDTDFDGVAEVVVADAPVQEGSSSKVRILGAGGELRGEFTAFGSNVKGMRISLGEIGGN